MWRAAGSATQCNAANLTYTVWRGIFDGANFCTNDSLACRTNIRILIFARVRKHVATPPQMASFSAKAMVEATMSTRISGLLLSVRNCNASVKMATEPTLLL